jgi:hypothetical protein
MWTPRPTSEELADRIADGRATGFSHSHAYSLTVAPDDDAVTPSR